MTPEQISYLEQLPQDKLGELLFSYAIDKDRIDRYAAALESIFNIAEDFADLDVIPEFVILAAAFYGCLGTAVKAREGDPRHQDLCRRLGAAVLATLRCQIGKALEVEL